MKYKRFEDLPVWKDAIELAVRTFALTAKHAFVDMRARAINLRMQSCPSQTISQKDSSGARRQNYLRFFTSPGARQVKLARCIV